MDDHVMICKNCNISVPEHAAFCPVCGTETGRTIVNEHVTKNCPQCGAENPLHAKFCRVDGWRFPSIVMESKPEVERASEGELRCPVCGTLHPATARFCRMDGSPLMPDHAADINLAGGKADTRMDGETPVQEPGKKATGFRNKRLWIYLAALLVFSFAVACWFFSGPATDSKSQPTAGDTEEVRKKQKTIQKNKLDKKKNEPQAGGGPKTTSRGYGQDIDLPRLEGQINRALRAQGLDGVKAEVDDTAGVTLKGVVKDSRDKKKAFEIAKSFSGVRQVKDIIFVIER
jgi:ribosomal protein L40E